MSAIWASREIEAAPSRSRRIVGIALSPLAGLAHLLVLERYLRGTLLAATAIVGASLVTAGSLVWSGPDADTLRGAGLSIVGMAVVLSVADALRWLVFTDHERRRQRRDAAFRRGLSAEVRDELEEAVRGFREALRIDPGHHAARFHLGVVLWRSKKPRAARREFGRCLRWDPARTWADEIRRMVAEMAPRPRRRR